MLFKVIRYSNIFPLLSLVVGDLSFVIYLQVPEEIVKENKETNHEHNNPGPGIISFDFGHDMKFSIALRIDLQLF